MNYVRILRPFWQAGIGLSLHSEGRKYSEVDRNTTNSDDYKQYFVLRAHLYILIPQNKFVY